MRCKWLLILCLCSHLCFAEQLLNLDVQNASLPDVIRIVAKFLHLNVMISNQMTGAVTLHLHHAEPLSAFNLLLTSHDLAKWQVGNVWYIATREELIKHKQDELKWQEIADQTAILQTEVWELHYAKAEDIAHLLQDDHAGFLSKRGHVRVDVRTNTICIQDTAEIIASAAHLIQTLDVPVKQIAIEAHLASVDDDCERELGVHFDVNPPGGITNVAAGQYSLAVAKLADASALDIKLAALENAGHAELISRPSLFTANQQPASIEAGEEVPYQEVSESGGTAVTFKKAVLGLKVTPQILPGNQVLLQLRINQDRPSEKLVGGVPTINTRAIVTNVLIKSGQTIVLGGIYEDNRESGEVGVPYLNRIPLLGVFFKAQHQRSSKRELLIFVKPTVIG